MDIFALFWSPSLFEEVWEMLVEMNRLSLTAPVRQSLIVRQKDKKLDSFLDRPSFMVEDRLLRDFILFFAYVDVRLLNIDLLFYLCVTLSACPSPQVLFNLILRHNIMPRQQEGNKSQISSFMLRVRNQRFSWLQLISWWYYNWSEYGYQIIS